jgi:hypothetical protein
VTSEEMRNDLEMLCAYAPGVGERRLISDDRRLEAAPDVETDPTSSWLKSVMALTLPSSVWNSGADALCARASTAQKLENVRR